MPPLKPGTEAPEVPGAGRTGTRALYFYKVTCPTCQISAPVAERFHQRLGDRFVGVGQDPREKLDRFGEELGATFTAVSDEPPYPLSDAYGIRVVPTVFVLEDGKVVDVVESWDRDGWNRVAAKAGELVGEAAEAVSWEGDGLPPFRPG
ncbi:MAG: peroxiredoxin family protein [Nocardioidaceae bacterium]